MRVSTAGVIGSALAGSVLALACLGGSCGGETDAPFQPLEETANAVVRGVVRDPSPDGRPLRYDLPRGGASTLSIRTLPNAVCVLRAASEPAADVAAANHLRVYADEEGVARLALRHAEASACGAELALDCSGEAGAHSTYVLDVRVAEGAASEAPAPPSRAPEHAPPGPAPLMYPPRPTVDAHDARWRDLATSGATILAPHLVAVPEFLPGPAQVGGPLANGTGSSANWSGYAIASSAATYGEVFGAWYVPRASSQPGGLCVDYSTFWVGMDGFGTQDVVQAGTSQNTETIFGVEVSFYSAWTEWYPLTMQSVSNLPVNPGDEIETWVWVATPANVWTPAGGNGWFLIWNVTENIASEVVTPVPFPVTYTGRSAEWVMERPMVNGRLSNLANYGATQMIDGWAYDYANELHLYTSDDFAQLTMTNGADVLSTVTPETPTSLLFLWHNSD